MPTAATTPTAPAAVPALAPTAPAAPLATVRPLGRLRRRLFGISPRETSVERRGFRCDSAAARQRLEAVGESFAAGYHLALATGGAPAPHGIAALAAGIAEAVPLDRRGFAFEGAAMGLALLDALSPRDRGRLRRFLAGPAAPHVYIAHVGAGWALARLPGASVDGLLGRLDPLLGWLAVDGYGFHQGYFHADQAVAGQRLPRRIAACRAAYAARAFDQGLGRSLWFVEGTDAGRVAAAVAAFPSRRRNDLWSGVGLAAAYACGAPPAALAELRRAAGEWQPALAQGAAFAAKCRLAAGNPTADNAAACAALCDATLEEAAAIADRAQPPRDAPAAARREPPRAAPGTAADGRDAAPLPAFELWRQRIQHTFATRLNRPGEVTA